MCDGRMALHRVASRCIANASRLVTRRRGCICAYSVRHCRFDFELWAKAPNGLEFEFLHRADTMLLNIGHMCAACGLSVATRNCCARFARSRRSRIAPEPFLLRGFPLEPFRAGRSHLDPSRVAHSHLVPRALRPLFSLSLRRKQTNKPALCSERCFALRSAAGARCLCSHRCR